MAVWTICFKFVQKYQSPFVSGHRDDRHIHIVKLICAPISFVGELLGGGEREEACFSREHAAEWGSPSVYRTVRLLYELGGASTLWRLLVAWFSTAKRSSCCTRSHRHMHQARLMAEIWGEGNVKEPRVPFGEMLGGGGGANRNDWWADTATDLRGRPPYAE